MPKAKVVYSEYDSVEGRLGKHPDFIHYDVELEIKDGVKTPVSLHLQFQPPYPFAGPVPKEKHTIKAKSVTQAYSKLVRWLKRYGYWIH
jgi:hypothetical protein